MLKFKKIQFFPKYVDRLLIIWVVALALFGSLMIVSADMGISAGSVDSVSRSIIKQVVVVLISLSMMYACMKLPLYRFRKELVLIGYVVFLASLLITRIWGANGGAYAWIYIGSFTIQPSEFCKFYIIFMGSYLLSKDQGEKNLTNFYTFMMGSFAYVILVLGYQKDLGSAVIMAGITYIIALIPPYKEIKHLQKIMFNIMMLGFLGIIFILSNWGTALLEKMGSNYMVGRFLASANPFAYQYNVGYHLVMSLVSFASCNIWGVGYGNSIHKYMNFPNPSSDFILPVIIEETGIFGFLIITFLYAMIIFTIIRHSNHTRNLRNKLVFVGAFMYITLHIILNVGGVTGLIPLTGVPLLLLSSGGSSTMSLMMVIGLCESEIIAYRKAINENNSRKIQA